MGKKIVYSMTPNRSSPGLTYGELAFAGFFSAVPTTLVAAPVERVKVLLQVNSLLLITHLISRARHHEEGVDSIVVYFPNSFFLHDPCFFFPT